VTSTVYDLFFNKPTRVTDPRGLMTDMEYEPWTGNPLSTTADSASLKARPPTPTTASATAKTL
jgi:hypothetical protein